MSRVCILCEVEVICKQFVGMPPILNVLALRFADLVWHPSPVRKSLANHTADGFPTLIWLRSLWSMAGDCQSSTQLHLHHAVFQHTPHASQARRRSGRERRRISASDESFWRHSSLLCRNPLAKGCCTPLKPFQSAKLGLDCPIKCNM